MMMNKHRADMHRQKERVVYDAKELIAGTEALLRSTASYTGGEIDAARENLRLQLEAAKQETGRLNRAAVEKISRASTLADEYAHNNPWPLLGVAALAGAIAGFCLNDSRRR
ncbi:DUF883 family protein [Pollutimonas sp. M17]|uniref:DUF883 family protein n=1 Tax=Pollutimonas sp. M17 TaxID=2962065 RepID=UPI0021F4F576|nr:DUF883 family protein [Pollutimonas sp. M17]UYO95328.1 DUF883 family protein [Pollutimonas sp. M17]HWK70420.1 DUF883 family protein [Burkholderiaceae bacterium]